MFAFIDRIVEFSGKLSLDSPFTMTELHTTGKSGCQ